jgi:hypothetical protein
MRRVDVVNEGRANAKNAYVGVWRFLLRGVSWGARRGIRTEGRCSEELKVESTVSAVAERAPRKITAEVALTRCTVWDSASCECLLRGTTVMKIGSTRGDLKPAMAISKWR